MHKKRTIYSSLLLVSLLAGFSFISAGVAPTISSKVLQTGGNITVSPPVNSSGSWYGIGEDYQLVMVYSSDPLTKENSNYLQDWQTILTDSRFTRWKFNTIRLDFRLPSMGRNPKFADDVQLNYTKFENVLKLLNSYGLKAVAADHSWQNFGSSAWMNDWTNFVTWLQNSPYRDVIVAYELRDECGEWTYEQGPWWNGQYCPNRSTSNWNEMVTGAYAELTDRIREIQPGALVTWADPAAYYSSYIPVQQRRDGVVYAWHVWTNDADDKGHTEPNAMANWKNTYLTAQYPNSRNWVGEFGSWYQTSSGEGVCTYAGQKYTFTQTGDGRYSTSPVGKPSLMQWCLDNNVGFSMFYWQHWNKQNEYSDWLQTVGFPESV